MSRSHRNNTRMSRPLIGALAVTIILGGSVYFHKHKPKSAGAATVPPIASNAKPLDAQASAGELRIVGRRAATERPDLLALGEKAVVYAAAAGLGLSVLGKEKREKTGRLEIR